VILAGGRGSRLGGREKGDIMVGGDRLVDIVVGGALAAGCEPAFVVGEIRAEKAETLREEPRFGGPVAGLAAALPHVRTDWLMLLACDLPHARLLCHLLAESFHHVDPGIDGVVALTDTKIQWLAGIYRSSALRDAVSALEDPAGASLKSVLGSLELREVQDPDGLARDVDTPEELEALVGRMEKR